MLLLRFENRSDRLVDDFSLSWAAQPFTFVKAPLSCPSPQWFNACGLTVLSVDIGTGTAPKSDRGSAFCGRGYRSDFRPRPQSASGSLIIFYSFF
jgi:hypothetical protein